MTRYTGQLAPSQRLKAGAAVRFPSDASPIFEGPSIEGLFFVPNSSGVLQQRR